MIFIYENYAKIRDEKGLTDYRVATETNIATSTMTAWKTGQYTPKVDKLMRIAKFLEVPIEAIIGDGDEES